MAVKVVFKIGHSSTLKERKSSNGYTHDWHLYVQGENKTDISQFVEKVVFHLHESFPRPKRVCKEPPYSVTESGYAGFTVFIDIYFRCREDPRKVQLTYDMDLQQSGPPQHRSEDKSVTLEDPSPELREKLVKGGGSPVSQAGNTAASQHLKEQVDVRDKPKTGGSDLNNGKKHKHSPRDGGKGVDLISTLFSGPPVQQHGKHNSKTSPETNHKKGGRSEQAESKERQLNKERERAGPVEKSNESRSDVKDRDKVKNSQSSPIKEKGSKKNSPNNGDGNRNEKRSREEDKVRRDRSHDKHKDKDRAVKCPQSPTPGARSYEVSPIKIGSANTCSGSSGSSGSALLHHVEADKIASAKSKHSSSSSKSKKENKPRDVEHERQRDHNKPKPSGEEKSKKAISQSNKSPEIAAVATQISSDKAAGSEPIHVLANSVQHSTPKSSNGKENSSAISKQSTSNSGGEKDKDKKGHRHKKKDKSKDKDHERAKEQQLAERDKEKPDLATKSSEKTSPSIEKVSPGHDSSANINNNSSIGSSGGSNGCTSGSSSNKKNKRRKAKTEKSERRSSESVVETGDSKANISSGNNTSLTDGASAEQSYASAQSQNLNSLNSSPDKPATSVNNASKEPETNEHGSQQPDQTTLSSLTKSKKLRSATPDCPVGCRNKRKRRHTNSGKRPTSANQCTDSPNQPDIDDPTKDSEHVALCAKHGFVTGVEVQIPSLGLVTKPESLLTQEQADWMRLVVRLQDEINANRDPETNDKVMDIVLETGQYQWLQRVVHFDLIGMERQPLLNLMEIFNIHQSTSAVEVDYEASCQGDDEA